MYKLWSYEILSVPSREGPEFCRIGPKTRDRSEDISLCLRYTRLSLPHCSHKQSRSACQLCPLSGEEVIKFYFLLGTTQSLWSFCTACKVSQRFKPQSTQPCTGMRGADATMLFWNPSVTTVLHKRALLQCFSFKCYQISEPGQVNKSCYSAVNSTAKKLVRFWLPAELHDQSVRSMIPRIQIFKIKMSLFQGGEKKTLTNLQN